MMKRMWNDFENLDGYEIHYDRNKHVGLIEGGRYVGALNWEGHLSGLAWELLMGL